ncbi:MAG: hypothetical protein GFH25_541324n38 [Chloroflexi bacterium AL-N10]|nr:hypothetical protein [Chloroflexi bacterium AL-N10]
MCTKTDGFTCPYEDQTIGFRFRNLRVRHPDGVWSTLVDVVSGTAFVDTAGCSYVRAISAIEIVRKKTVFQTHRATAWGG